MIKNFTNKNCPSFINRFEEKVKVDYFECVPVVLRNMGGWVRVEIIGSVIILLQLMLSRQDQ